MKAADFVHIEFIKDLLRKGQQRKEILPKYAQKWPKQSLKTFDRRLTVAKGALQLEQKMIKAEVDKAVAKEIEARKSRIMTAIERQELLTQIMAGEIDVPDDDVKWNPSEEKFQKIKRTRKPNHRDRISAIAELNKMDGSHAPIKTNVKVNAVGLDAIEEKYE